jgi:hypothetical protein
LMLHLNILCRCPLFPKAMLARMVAILSVIPTPDISRNGLNQASHIASVQMKMKLKRKLLIESVVFYGFSFELL